MKSRRSPPSIYSNTRSTSSSCVRAWPATQPKLNKNFKKSHKNRDLLCLVETSRGEAKNGWMVELLQNVDLSLEIRHGGSRAAMAVASAAVVFVIVVRRVKLLRVEILTAHQPPVVRAIAFMTVANVPRPSSCAMSSCACTPVNSFGARSVDELVVFDRLLLLHRRAECDLFSSRRMHDSPLATHTPLICECVRVYAH